MEMDSKLFRQWPSFLLPGQDWYFTHFIDKVVLSIFRLFDPTISRISEELKSFIHPDLIGSWFLSKDHSLIRVFGFSAAPLILPVFLTSNVFSLELMRQRLHSDIEHFTAPKLKKSAWIKYPLTVGHYVLKKEGALPIIEKVLKQFKFPEAMPLNYDPKHVISNRRLENDRSTFQHSAILDISKEENSLEFDFPWSFQRVPDVVQIEASIDPAKDESTKKRPIFEATNMDTKQQESGKKPKIVTELEIIDVDQRLNQEVHILTYVQEENPQLESISEQSA